MNHEMKIEREGVALKPLTLEDALVTVDFRNACRDMFFVTGLISPEQQRVWYANYAEKPNDYMFAIFDEGDLVGQLGLYDVDPTARTCEFGRLVIDPARGGKGLGRRAMIAACQIAFEQLAMEKVALEVLDCNEKAAALYRSIGFEVLRASRLEDGRNVTSMVLTRKGFEK